jgi:O-antigen ligase
MSHWMTLGGQLSVLIPPVLAFALTEKQRRWRWALLIMTIALALNLTRGIWIATGLAAVCVVGFCRPRLLWALPVVALAALAFEPVRQRTVSIFRPNGETDSNQHRIVTWRTGVEMVKAHPWFGLGPDGPGRHFAEYIPGDIRRPLPDGAYGHLHNTYLQYAADRGLPALLVFVWFLVAMARTWWHQRPDALALGAVGAWVAVLAGGLTEWNLGNTEVLHLFLVMAACGDYAACSKARIS